MGESFEARPPGRPGFVTLAELVDGVADGSRIGVGGALLSRLPLVMLHALAERRPRDLTYVSWGGGIPLEILLGADAVAKIVFCFSSLDIFGLAPLFRQAVEEDRVAVDEWPAFPFTAGLEAAKQNLPVMPFRWPEGTDLLGGQPAVSRDAGRPGLGFADRLDLDVFLLHAQRADAAGNVEIFGARGMDATAAFAARRVLVTVEEVVPSAELGTLRNSFVLPRHFVHALAVAPAGAYPTSCLPYYTADFAELARVTAQSPPPPAAPAPAVLRRLGDAAALGHDAVRAAAAGLAATRDENPGSAARAGATRQAEAGATVDELMVCWLASQLGNDSICSAGAVSPLAATAYLLAKATHAPGLAIFMTSGGLLDVAERPMLLSLGEALDTASAAVVCGGEDSYRWYYQQGRVTCEVVTVAQVDRRARTNNIELTSPSGRRVRLPGQGGMADVADLHQNFSLYLTRHSPLTLVENVQRLSAARCLTDPAARRAAGLQPGATTLITNLGVFRYEPDRAELVLRSLHPGVSLDQLRAATGFEPAVAADLTVTGEPAAEVLRVLREQVDPLGIRRLEFAPARERAALLAACIAAEQDLIDLALRQSRRADRAFAPAAKE
ncbi:MAG TPA: CoA-transferase [Trebonia sp.]|jgi:glutaconate CoA-transferase subunit A